MKQLRVREKTVRGENNDKEKARFTKPIKPIKVYLKCDSLPKVSGKDSE